MKFYVYGYYDPRNRTPMYFGEGKDKRAYSHLKKAYNLGLAAAIFELRGLGLNPIINIEEYFATRDEALIREIEIIAHYGRRIFNEGPLYNITAGGDGLDEETARRIWADPKIREKRLKHLHRLNTDPENRKRNAEMLRGLRDDPETSKQLNDHIHQLNLNPKFRELNHDHLLRINADPRINELRAESMRRYHERKRQEKH